MVVGICSGESDKGGPVRRRVPTPVSHNVPLGYSAKVKIRLHIRQIMSATVALQISLERPARYVLHDCPSRTNGRTCSQLGQGLRLFSTTVPSHFQCVPSKQVALPWSPTLTSCLFAFWWVTKLKCSFLSLHLPLIL